MPAKVNVATEIITTNPSFLEKYNEIKEIREKKNMDKKNFGKIVLKTTLAFSGLNFVKITEVFIPTWNKMNPTVKPFANKETNSYINRIN